MIPPGLPRNEAERLAELRDYDVLDTAAEQAYDDLAHLASEILQVPITLVSLVDEDRQWFKAKVGLDAAETPRDISFCGHVVANDAMLVVEDATQDARFADNPLVVGDPAIRFYAGAPLRTPEGHVVGTLCAIDRTPRELSPGQVAALERLARQVVSLLELRRRDRDLRRANAFMSGVLQRAPVVILATDREGHVTAANHFAVQLLGFDPAESEAPRTVASFYAVGARSAPAGVAAEAEAESAGWEWLQASLRAGEEAPAAAAVWLTADGTQVPVRVTLTSLEGGGGYLVVAQDETERRRNERRRQELVRQIGRQNIRLERALEEAQQASEAKTRFHATMSHELRTPMNSILGFTRRLLKRLPGKVSPRDLEALETVDRNARNLLGLVNELLDVASIEAGRFELHPESTDLCELVRRTTEEHRSLFVDGAHELVLDLPEEGPVLAVDPKRIRQVLVNLISNALKYSPGGAVEVALSETEDGDLGEAVCLSVRDHGAGLTQEERKGLFERFGRLDNLVTRGAEGTGLGLTICAEIASRHGGRIDLWSEEGQGSRFTLVLPRVPVAVEREVSTSPSESLASGDGPVVLCVDDDEEVLAILEVLLEQAEMRPVLATSFEAAVALAREVVPDLICLDARLSGKDGFALFEVLRDDPLTRDVPVLIVSGDGEARGRAERLEVDFMAKPFAGDALIQRIREALLRTVGEILVVDDEPDVRAMVLGLLEDNGLTARVARGGAEALEMMTASTPSVVLLDLMMPDLDGFQVLEAMASSSQLQGVPVVVHTAMDLDAEQLMQLRRYGSLLLRKGEADEGVTLGRLLEASRGNRKGRGSA